MIVFVCFLQCCLVNAVKAFLLLVMTYDNAKAFLIVLTGFCLIS